MAGRFLITLLAFALPFLLYGAYRWVQARRKAEGRDPWPMMVLWLVGAVLAAETLALGALDPANSQRDRYESPFRNEIAAPKPSPEPK